MSPAQPPAESLNQPGDLLSELDRRQDDVLEQLDQLQARIDSVLGELGISAIDPIDESLEA